MRIVIIGSKGFIGQHLYGYLIHSGDDVMGADVVTDYANTHNYFLVDATNSDFSLLFQKKEFDICINCSGAASVPDSISNPLRDYTLNTDNVFKILEAIRKYQPDCALINISSAAVYGNPKVLPIKESVQPNPLSPYGFHKHLAEELCREFWELFHIRTCSLRVFSVYGPGLQKQLFWDLYKKASLGHPFSLYGTGDESRDFIHISDLVKAIRLIAVHSNFKAEIINIANGEGIYIKEAVVLFLSFFERVFQYSFSGNAREGDPANWKADITKLKSYGYSPSINIRDGLHSYFNWVAKLEHQ